MSKHRHRGKRAQRPPDGVAWVWHTVELLDSAAWRGRSIHCRRLIDFLEREQLHHGGNENGNLLATYSQLQAEGISRKSIHGAIQEAEQCGLVAVERGGRKGAVLNELNRFRLTYLWHRTRKDGVWNWHEPTDNWRSYEAPTRAISAQTGTATVPKRELPTVPKWEPRTPQVIEITQTATVPKREAPSISGQGASKTVPSLTASRIEQLSAMLLRKVGGAGAPVGSAVARPATLPATNSKPLKALPTTRQDERIRQAENF